MRSAFYQLLKHGYEYFITTPVNPIVMMAESKSKFIHKQKYQTFEEFEFEGTKPFKDFTFLESPTYIKPGVLANLFKFEKNNSQEMPKL